MPPWFSAARACSRGTDAHVEPRTQEKRGVGPGRGLVPSGVLPGAFVPPRGGGSQGGLLREGHRPLQPLGPRSVSQEPRAINAKYGRTKAAFE